MNNLFKQDLNILSSIILMLIVIDYLTSAKLWSINIEVVLKNTVKHAINSKSKEECENIRISMF